MNRSNLSRINVIGIAVLLMLQLPLHAQTVKTGEANDTHLITNAGSETGNLTDWRHWSTRYSEITKEAYSGNYALKIGPERAFCRQEIKIRSNSHYRISAFLKTESDAEEVRLMVSDYGGGAKSVSSSLTEYTKVSIDFETAYSADELLISFIHPSGKGSGFVDQIELIYLGKAPIPKLQEFAHIPKRILKEDNGVSQLPDEKMDWFLNCNSTKSTRCPS